MPIQLGISWHLKEAVRSSRYAYLVSSKMLMVLMYFVFFRYSCFLDYVDKVSEGEGGLDNFTQGYKWFGIHINSDNSVTCREWAPGANELFLFGDFSRCFLFN